MKLSEAQLDATAACVLAIRALPPDDRMDVIVVLAKSLIEPRANLLLFPETERTR